MGASGRSKGYSNQPMVGNYGAHSKRTYEDHGRYGQNQNRFMVGQSTKGSRKKPSALIRLTEKQK